MICQIVGVDGELQRHTIEIAVKGEAEVIESASVVPLYRHLVDTGGEFVVISCFVVLL